MTDVNVLHSLSAVTSWVLKPLRSRSTLRRLMLRSKPLRLMTRRRLFRRRPVPRYRYSMPNSNDLSSLVVRS
jgi:hypothetical protein